MRRTLVLSVLFLLFLLPWGSPAAGIRAQCPSGSYETAWNHNNTPTPSLNALHLAIIPRGTFAGKALVWNYGARNTMPPQAGKSLDRTNWAIIDPETRQVVLQATLQHDADTGDLGCSGHAWTRDGTLVVAGGTKYSFESELVVGARHMYIFDPSRSHVLDPNNLWVKQDAQLERDRWYPSVYMIAEQSPSPSVEPRLLVLGGDGAFVNSSGHLVEYSSRPLNTYEAFVPPASTSNPPQGSFEMPQTRPGTQIFWGPADGDSDLTKALGFYPRMQLLADGKLFWAGFRRTSFLLQHEIAPETYTPVDDANAGYYDRNYACCLQFPNISAAYTNLVMILGGSSSLLAAGALDSVQMSKGTALASGCWPTPSPGGRWWTDFIDSNHNNGLRCTNEIACMLEPRYLMNVVILSDASLLAIGGTNAAGWLASVERFANSAWTAMASDSSLRGYHSTAAYVPSGKVLFAGGENRFSDYRLFRPPYICPGLLQPTITSVNNGNTSLSYGQVFTVRFTAPLGTTVDKVVLMRPSSVTHHTDYDQRYVRLESVGSAETPEEIEVRMPPYRPGMAPLPLDPNQLSCLPGYYMLVVVTDGGTPSVAEWVVLK